MDFPHASPAHRAVALAGVLTIVARPAVIGSVPATLHDATTRGTGKTLESDVIHTIGTGRAAAKMGYPANDEELEKVKPNLKWKEDAPADGGTGGTGTGGSGGTGGSAPAGGA